LTGGLATYILTPSRYFVEHFDNSITIAYRDDASIVPCDCHLWA